MIFSKTDELKNRENIFVMAVGSSGNIMSHFTSTNSLKGTTEQIDTGRNRKSE